MYIPQNFAEQRRGVLHDFIGQFPLGTLVTRSGPDLQANHIPFLVAPDAGPFGILRGHVARNNPVWSSLLENPGSLVVFQGPQSYISPSWYRGKTTHGGVVPTWNYVAVHVYGNAVVIEDREWLLRHVTQLTVKHESEQPNPWRVTDAPAQYLSKMLDAIVGLEIPIVRIEGKWKVSQNRSRDDRSGIIAGLNERVTPVVTMAALVGATLD